MSREREVEVPRDGETINIMVVSDVRLYREGLAGSLAQRHRLAVVSIANSIDDLTRVQECNPDIIVLDMSGRGTLDSIKRISSSSLRARVVAFAVEETERDVLLCAEAGAAGYVPCDGTIDDLVNTIHAVARGELLCSPRIAATLFRALHAHGPKPDGERLALTLTAREREIAPLIDRGLSNKEIAAHLRIEVATVKNHVHNLLEKLQVASRGEAAARLRAGVGAPGIQLRRDELARSPESTA
jgi:DNA-binding NarL/FixJ family response regulator